MAGRMEGKSAVVVGAGQSVGANVGNGRAIAMLLAREDAQVLCVDRDEASAADTVAMSTPHEIEYTLTFTLE